MASDSVLLEHRDGIARITLNRPDKLNSFDNPMLDRMLEVLGEVRAERTVRAVYLTGAGRAFCAGQDISTQVPDGDYGAHLRKHWNPIALGFKALEVPVVAAVNGVAAGAGANLALCADFVVAAEEASFIQAFINIGLVPDTAGSWTVPQLIGPARAAAHLMLGDKLPAATAAEWGLIYRAVPLAELETTAWALAVRLAAMPTKALGLTKRMIRAAATNSLDEQLALEAECQAIAGRSRDHVEGVTAFREKRKPEFLGE
ncbi:MAG: enoyl-CoA hydratase-related protein [Gemmatimonadales bacterium]